MTFVKTALFHKAGEGSGGGGGGGDQHNLGWYATESALTTAHATATDGDWAIVGATDTVWVWDSDTTAWVDTGAAGIELPDQTGHSGQFLTTDGSSASWSAISALQNTATGADALTILGTATTGTSAINIGVGSSCLGGGVSIGKGAQGNGSGDTCIGRGAKGWSYNSISIGTESKASEMNSIAIGRSAYASATYAIQIGCYNNTTTTNSDANTFKVANANGNYEIMSADGTIPEARLADTTNAQQGDVLTLDSTGNAVWQAGGGGGASIAELTSLTAAPVAVAGSNVSDARTMAVGLGASAGSSGLANSGTYCTAIGIGAKADQNYATNSTAIGADASTTSNFSVAVGSFAQADFYGVAIGAHVTSGNGGIIIGGNGSANKVGTANSLDILLTKNVNYQAVTNQYTLLGYDGIIPAARHASLPAADGTYVLKLVIASGVPTLSWVAE